MRAFFPHFIPNEQICQKRIAIKKNKIQYVDVKYEFKKGEN